MVFDEEFLDSMGIDTSKAFCQAEDLSKHTRSSGFRVLTIVLRWLIEEGQLLRSGDKICEIHFDHHGQYENVALIPVDGHCIITRFLAAPSQVMKEKQVIYEYIPLAEKQYKTLKKLQKNGDFKEGAVISGNLQQSKTLNDVAIFNQFKSVLDLYNKEIMRVKKDETLDDEQKEETIAQLKDLRDEHINKLR